MSTIREGISNFLSASTPTSPFLIPRYHPNLETQVMVHEGHEANENGHGWTGEGQDWDHARWPHNSNTIPTYKDRPITYSPRDHCKVIGTSWWDFVNKVSVAIGLDIDTVDGHAETTSTVTGIELERIIELLSRIPYLTLVRSKSGNGIHVYVFFDPADLPKSANHTEHKKHAHALLAKLCKDMDYDLGQHVDVLGNIFWIWANQTGKHGFELIQDAAISLGAKDLAEFYEEAPVTTPIILEGYTKSGLLVKEPTPDLNAERYPLDETHKELIKALEDFNYEYVWLPEYNMVQTRTCALQELFEQRKAEGHPLKGLFKTVSYDKEPKRNCYLTPRQDGSFKVTRFGGVVAEDSLWSESGGKTVCYFNQPVNPLTILKKFASKVSRGTRMTFDPDRFIMALDTLEAEHPKVTPRTPIIVTLYPNDGTYKAECKCWDKSWWLSFVQADSERIQFTSQELEEADKHVRHLMSSAGTPMGFAVKWNNGWILPAKDAIVGARLQALFGQASTSILNDIVLHSWTVTDRPFEDEYPGGRIWNKNSVHFKVPPADTPGPHPHWDLIFEHLGQRLNPEVKKHSWCQKWSIYSGADYLRYWLTSLVKCPFEPLPYLFFYGQQETGKSMFYEMMNFIFTGGITRANTSLTNSSDFNGELDSAIVAFIEEMDLAAHKGTYDKIKELVTARQMMVHAKGMTPYPHPNKLHFIQTGQKPTYCPVEEGDTRIVVVEVPKIEKEIPRHRFERALQKEAANFLRTIVDIPLNEPINRLNLPALNTSAKESIGMSNRDSIQSCLADVLHDCPGYTVSVSDAYKAYQDWCQGSQILPDSASKFRAGLSPTWVVGIGTGNQKHIANSTLDPSTTRRSKKPLRLVDSGRLAVQ